MYQRQYQPMLYGPTLSMDSAPPTLPMPRFAPPPAPVAEPQQGGRLPMLPMGLLQSFGGGSGLLGGEGAGGVLGGEGFAGMGAMATPLAFAALIAGGKMIEHDNPDSWYGRALLSGLGPSISQIEADPKLGLLTAIGLPFLGGWLRSDDAADTAPEWAGLFGG